MGSKTTPIRNHGLRFPLMGLFGAALGGWTVCIFVRALLAYREYPPGASAKGVAQFSKMVAMFSAPDGAILAALLAIGAVALLIAGRNRVTRRIIIVAWTALFAIVLVLAVTNVATIPMYRWPLTVQLLRYSRVLSDTAGLRYIVSLTPTSAFVGLALALLVPVAGMAAGHRLARVNSRALVWALALFAGLAAIYGVKSARELAKREDNFLFTNATVAFALSTITPPIERFAEEARSAPLPPEPPVVGPAPSLPSRRPRNVIFFVIESLGAQYVNGYGGSWDVMPNLKAALRQGVKIDHAYAHAPSSTVALYSMLQSAVPLQLEATGRESTRDSLVEVARRNGLRTAFFASGVPYDDEIAYLRAARVDRIEDSRQIPCAVKHSLTTEPVEAGIDNRCAISAMLKWIDESRSPFFAVLWNYQTHYPYYVNGIEREFATPKGMPPGHVRPLNIYLNAVQETDANLGELLRRLDERQLSDSTLVVVLGDHGEAFGQHGTGGHGSDIYEESVHIPMALLFPGFVSAQEYRGLFGEMDLAPTVARVMGFDPPSGWTGVDIFSGIRNRRIYLYAAAKDTIVGYRDGQEKVMLRMREPALADLFAFRTHAESRLERYDLRSDPGERRNLGFSDPRQSQIARQRLSHWVANASGRH